MNRVHVSRGRLYVDVIDRGKRVVSVSESNIPAIIASFRVPDRELPTRYALVRRVHVPRELDYVPPVLEHRAGRESRRGRRDSRILRGYGIDACGKDHCHDGNHQGEDENED